MNFVKIKCEKRSVSVFDELLPAINLIYIIDMMTKKIITYIIKINNEADGLNLNMRQQILQ